MTNVFRRLARHDGGLTVIEVMIASLLFLVLTMAVLSLLDSGTRSERVSQARDDAQVMLRGAVGTMTKEVRQATYVDSTSDQSNLYMKTLLDGVEYWVAYKVIGTVPTATLQRLQCSAPASSTTMTCLDSATPVQLADRIVAVQAFCYLFDDPDCIANPNHPTSTTSAIHISLQVSPVVFSQGTVTLATDVQLRNIKQ
jgi:Tfp pilus assembly protein PilW